MNNERFWKLLEPEHAAAQRFCRRLAGNDDDGNDLYQDSLLAALQQIDRLRDTGAFKGWLYRILINRYRNRVRQFRRRPTEAFDDTVMTDHAHDPSGELTARRWLERAFGALKPDEKALVILFELEGWTVSDLATNLGKPEGTIKARLARARRKMRREVEKYLAADTSEPLTGKAGYALPQEPE